MDGVKRALNDRRMDMREASERARNRNDSDAVLIGICCCQGWPYSGSPVVGQ